MAQLRYRDAAGQFADAARKVPEASPDIRLGYLDREAAALFQEGEERGDNPALIEAIERYGILLTLRPRDRVPLEWAMTQNKLGSTLRALGLREQALGLQEPGTAHLEEAVAAFREALKEYRRDRVPLDWARTQNRLGNALRALGERESGTVHLEEAVAVFRAALKEYRRDREPLEWAMSAGDQGVTFMILAHRLGDATKAQKAVNQIEAALMVMRDFGNVFDSYYSEQLLKARALLNRFASR